MVMNGSAPNRSELARLLREARSAYDLEGVEALIAGVLGAPQEIGASVAHAGCRPGDAGLGPSAGSAAPRDGGRLSRRSRPRGFRGSAERRAARPPAPRAFGAAPRRIHRAALGRASGRIRAAARPAPGLAHRLYRLGRAGGRAARARGALRRRPLHVAGGAAGRWRACSKSTIWSTTRRQHWIGSALTAGAVLGYDPWLHTPHEVERFRVAAEKAGASLRAVGDNPLDRVWPDQPAAPLAPVVPHARGICRRGRALETQPARPRPGRGRGRRGGPDDARIDRLAPQHPRRRRAAHAVAAVLRHPARRRHASPCSSTAASSPPASTAISAIAVTIADARSAGAGARCARRRARTGAGRSGECRVVDFRPARSSRGQAPPRRRSVHLAQGVQEHGRGRGHPRGSSPRRRGIDPLSRLARARGAEGRPLRDRRQRPARSLSPRGRIFPRSELSDDLRRRVERCHRPLPGDAGDRKAPRTRHPLSCSIRARNISTAPPT